MERTLWKFIGRDKHGWLGFRAVTGPGSILSDAWVGDLYVAPDAYWAPPNVRSHQQKGSR